LALHLIYIFEWHTKKEKQYKGCTISISLPYASPNSWFYRRLKSHMNLLSKHLSAQILREQTSKTSR